MNFRGQVKRVTAYELRALFGSARTITVLILFLLIAILASGAVASCYEKAPGAQPKFQMQTQGGAAGPQLPENFFVRSALGYVFDREDPDFLDFLSGIPVYFLLYLWGCLFLYPFLIALLGYDQVSGDLATGTAKFSILRVSRPAYVLGKVSAQAVLFLILSLLNAGAAVAMAAGMLPEFDFGQSLALVAGFWPSILAQGVCYLGITAFWSMSFTTPGGALGMSLLTPVLFWAIAFFTYFWDLGGGYKILGGIGYLSPEAMKFELFREPSWELGLAMLVYIGVGVGFFLIGLRGFNRRDL